jgi:NitT/TauT family transport system substrate-binding protein
MRLATRTLCAALVQLCAMLPASAQEVVRVGHFPNITHVQALVARSFERQGRNWFAERLGPGVTVQWYVYNAGPSAMEAIFAEAIDLTYVGPNPALNAYARSRGEEVRVVAGAVNGGSASGSRRRNSATRRMLPRAPGWRPEDCASRRRAATHR